MLEVVGLGAALAKHAEEFVKRTGITLHFEDNPDANAASPDVALCLFRVAQEALHTLEGIRLRNPRS